MVLLSILFTGDIWVFAKIKEKVPNRNLHGDLGFCVPRTRIELARPKEVTRPST
jgi:hypothetical protein